MEEHEKNRAWQGESLCGGRVIFKMEDVMYHGDLPPTIEVIKTRGYEKPYVNFTN